MSSGVDKAWELIKERQPVEVCGPLSATHDPDTGCYGVSSLGMDFILSPETHEVRGATSEAEAFYDEHRMYFDHSVIWYLAVSGGAGRTGRLVKPSDIKGGHHFFTRGTHVLPLNDLAARYAADAGAFIRQGLALGGREAAFGDAALELLPLPTLPVVLILWEEDSEFSARADLLLDSSAEYQAPLDVIWSAAMLALRAMM